jgi:hypothetical protein
VSVFIDKVRVHLYALLSFEKRGYSLKNRHTRRSAEEEFQQHLTSMQVVPGVSQEDAFYGTVLQALIGKIDQMISGKNSIPSYWRKNPGRFEVATFHHSNRKTGPYYSVSARHITENLRSWSVLISRRFRKDGQLRKRQPKPNLKDACWGIAIHEVRHRIQSEGGKNFRLFTGASYDLVDDSLLRAIIHEISEIVRIIARGRKKEPGLFKWISQPVEQDALIIEIYVLHVWDRVSVKELRRIMRLQTPEAD